MPQVNPLVLVVYFGIIAYYLGAAFTFRLTLRWMFREYVQVTGLDVLWAVLLTVLWPVFLPLVTLVIVTQNLRKPKDLTKLRRWLGE